MERILTNANIPETSGIAIEYHIPRTSHRIDVLISGYDKLRSNNLVIVELKQWTWVEKTQKDGIVTTIFSGRSVETTHPSHQAWSYSALLQDFCEPINSLKMNLAPCVYLHNLKDASALKDMNYSYYVDRAPLFSKRDSKNLSNYIAEKITLGDDGMLIRAVDEGPFYPSKSLVDELQKMLEGNSEFLMIDDQKLAYEAVLDKVNSQKTQKQACIIEAGPGIDKSVIAINLLCKLLATGKSAAYVTKNSAPRAVFQAKLTKSLTKTRFSNLFISANKFWDTEKDAYDVVLVDEAHLLHLNQVFLGKAKIK